VRVKSESLQLDRRDVFFTTRPPHSDAPAVLDPVDLAKLEPGWLAFEALTESPALTFYETHNTIRIYTWGNAECCLERGATRATLLDETTERGENDPYDPNVCDPAPATPQKPNRKQKPKSKELESYGDDHEHYDGCGCPPPPPPPRAPRPLHLQAGDFLLFEELACAGTVFAVDPQNPEAGGFDGETPQPDADRTHRHVVRLTKVTQSCDPLLGNRVLEVEWSREDALPFALCVSAIGVAPQCDLVKNLAVARGNIVLTDHGLTIADEPLDPIPVRPIVETCEGVDAPADIAHLAGRYRPILQRGPLTFAEPLVAGAPATVLLQQNPRAALPAIEARSIPLSSVQDEEHRPQSAAPAQRSDRAPRCRRGDGRARRSARRESACVDRGVVAATRSAGE
jgi:hypothetical protein